VKRNIILGLFIAGSLWAGKFAEVEDSTVTWQQEKYISGSYSFGDSTTTAKSNYGAKISSNGISMNDNKIVNVSTSPKNIGDASTKGYCDYMIEKATTTGSAGIIILRSSVTILQSSVTILQGDISVLESSATANSDNIEILISSQAILNSSTTILQSDVAVLKGSVTINADAVSVLESSVTINTDGLAVVVSSQGILNDKMIVVYASITINADNWTNVVSSQNIIISSLTILNEEMDVVESSITVNADDITILESSATANADDIAVNKSSLTAIHDNYARKDSSPTWTGGHTFEKEVTISSNAIISGNLSVAGILKTNSIKPVSGTAIDLGDNYIHGLGGLDVVAGEIMEICSIHNKKVIEQDLFVSLWNGKMLKIVDKDDAGAGVDMSSNPIVNIEWGNSDRDLEDNLFTNISTSPTNVDDVSTKGYCDYVVKGATDPLVTATEFAASTNTLASSSTLAGYPIDNTNAGTDNYILKFDDGESDWNWEEDTGGNGAGVVYYSKSGEFPCNAYVTDGMGYIQMPSFAVTLTTVTVNYGKDGTASVGIDGYDLMLSSTTDGSGSWQTIVSSSTLFISSGRYKKITTGDFDITAIPSYSTIRLDCPSIAATTPGGDPIMLMLGFIAQ